MIVSDEIFFLTTFNKIQVTFGNSLTFEVFFKRHNATYIVMPTQIYYIIFFQLLIVRPDVIITLLK